MTIKIGYSTLCLQNKDFNSLEPYLSKYPRTVIEILNDGLHALNSKRIKKMKTIGLSYCLNYTMHLPFAHFNYAVTNPYLRKAVQRIILKALSQAAQLECTHAVIHSGQTDTLSQIFFPDLAEKYYLNFLKIVGKTGEDLGIQTLIENNFSPSYFINSKNKMSSFFETEISNYFKVTLDIGHAFLRQDLEDYFKFSRNIISYVHLHNNNGIQDDHLQIDEGKIDWKTILKRLMMNNFEGIIIIENLNWEDNEKSLNSIKNFLKLSYEHIERIF